MSKNSWTLREITLVNWGTYDGTHTIDLTPTGEGNRMATCIEGVNGSGKTTLTDAYMMLIRPIAPSFNAASNSSGKGDGKRTVRSYMRGEVGDNPETGEPWVIRESDIIVSAIKGLFSNGEGDTLEAAILMCINCVTDTREHRLYATSKHKIDLAMLDGVSPSEFTPKGLRALLGNDVNITEHHSDYQKTLSVTFGVSPVWTDFQKLTRLLSMVQGEDSPEKSRINALFKAYVLPASDVEQRIRDAREIIDNNQQTLFDLNQKKTLIDTLEPMGQLVSEAEPKTKRLAALRSLMERPETDQTPAARPKAPIDVFIDEYRLDVLTENADAARTKLEEASQALKAADEKVLETDAAQLEAFNARNANGDERIDSAKTRLDRARADLSQAESARDDAKGELLLAKQRVIVSTQTKARAAASLTREQKARETAQATIDDYLSRGARYGLSSWPKTQDAWTNMLATISFVDVEQEAELKRCVSECRDKTPILKQKQQAAVATLERLRQNKAKFGANYPNLTRARDRIAQAMGTDPAELPFLAEIVKVADDEREWSTAINSQLAPVARRMLIDKSYVPRFRKVSRTVERELGLRISYTEVDFDEDDKYEAITPKPGTVASKVEVDWQSSYADSALGLIYRNDAICVENADEFEADGRHYVTRGGQTYSNHRGTIGFSRRDNDILGFVSEYDIEDAEATVENYKNDLRKILTKQNACETKLRDIDRRRLFSEEMHRVSFDTLDLAKFDKLIEEAAEYLCTCEDDLAACEQNVEDREIQVQTSETKVEDANQRVKDCESTLEKMRLEASESFKELNRAYEAAKAAHQIACNEQGVAKTNYELARSQLAWYENEIRNIPTDRGELAEELRELCKEFTTDTFLAQSFESFSDTLATRCRTIRTRISTATEREESALSVMVAKFGELESKMGKHHYDNLSGLPHEQAVNELRNSRFAEFDLGDPCQRMQALWAIHYSHLLEQLREEWSGIDMLGAKRLCARNTIDAVEALLANAKSSEKDIDRRMKSVRDIIKNVNLGSEDHTLDVAYNFRKKATAAKTQQRLQAVTEHASVTRTIDATEEELDAACEATRQVSEFMQEHTADVIAALDPNEYVNISFIETRDGYEHKHANLGKLSGGEVQQISACVIGAALLYAMDTEPGQSPCYATVVIDEAFVKADEEHSVATLATLINMGFMPVVSMPPEGVMKLSPCISKLMAVTKHDMRSSVHEISLAELMDAQ